MIRTMDPAPFVAIADHPEVRPWLGIIDPHATINQIIAPIVVNPANYCLLTPQGDGGYILTRLAPGLYASHTLALPSARGRPMLRLMREGFQFMFSATDAVEIVTQIPDGNDNAARWSDVAGFRDTFRREKCFHLMGEKVGSRFRSLSWQDWAISSPQCRTAGVTFHDALHEHGAVDHDIDPVHDALAGASMLCAAQGLVTKGVSLYNRWALTAGYMPAQVISDAPPLVDIGTAVVGLCDGVLTVLSSQRTREARPFLPKDEPAPCPLEL